MGRGVWAWWFCLCPLLVPRVCVCVHGGVSPPPRCDGQRPEITAACEGPVLIVSQLALCLGLLGLQGTCVVGGKSICARACVHFLNVLCCTSAVAYLSPIPLPHTCSAAEVEIGRLLTAQCSFAPACWLRPTLLLFLPLVPPPFV